MKSLIPWRKQMTEPVTNGGELVPFTDFTFSLSRLRDEFDRLFDRMAREFSSLMEMGKGWRWGLEVEDQDDNIIVRAEAPGFEPGDFDVRVEDNRLVLRASRKVETKDEKGRVKEYRQQECYESVALPTGIDRDRVEARYHSGVLTITLPKTAAAKAKKIAVKAT
ncbi:MAG TPA: Hsp20/alpha crystallin family protein [Methylomirabilota bacterium]|nr:Hsp20/alpha crystallin family protein [Methylomirabilota bacterium]